jgi:hypothetical protein
MLWLLLLILIQPLGGATMNNLLPQPHQTDEGAECTRHHKTTLQAVRHQVLSVDEGTLQLSHGESECYWLND